MSRLRQLQKEAKVALPTSGEVYKSDDGTVSTVLDDQYDPNYEPTKQELEDYAEWLGLSLPEDEELMWIAREGLKAPVPREWKPCKTDTGEVYYFNFKTGESLWDHPLDEYFKNKFATEKEKLDQRRAQEAKDKARKAAEEKDRAAARARTEKAEREAEEARKRAAEAERERERARAAAEEEEREAAKRREAMAAAATKRNAGLALPAAKAAVVIPTTTTTTPAASPRAETLSASATEAPSPRLMTESDKKRQAAIRKEMDAAMAAALKAEEDRHSAAVDDAVAANKRALDSMKATSQAKVRQATQDAEDKVQEDLEARQRQAEARHKKAIQGLEDEIETIRQQIRDNQRAQAEKLSRGEAQVDASIASSVAKRVAELEAEIARERKEHADLMQSRQRSARLKFETEEDAAATAAVEAASKAYSDAATARQAQHDAAVARLKADKAATLAAEQTRIERANHGEVAQLVKELQQRAQADVAAIEKAGADELAAITASEEAALQEQARSFRAQEGAASGLDPAEEMALKAELGHTVERQTDEKISDARERSDAAWKERERLLMQQRQQELAEEEAQAATSSGQGVDLASLEVNLAAQRRKKAADLRQECDARLAAEVAALKEAQQRRHDARRGRDGADKASALQAFKDETLKKYAAMEAQIRAQAASLSEADAAAAAKLAATLQRLRNESNERIAADTKRLRDAHERRVAESVAELADDLIRLEQQRRREVEVQIASPDSSLIAHSESAAPAPVVTVYDDSALLAARLSQLRAEFATAEANLRAQPFLAASGRSDAPSPPHMLTRPPSSQHSNSLGSIDARQPSIQAAQNYVEQQHHDAEHRAAALAAARHQSSSSSIPVAEARSHSARRSSTPLLQPDIAMVLMQLNDKVNTLLANVVNTPTKLPDTSSALEIDSPPRHRRSSRGEFERPSSRTRRTQSATRRHTPSGGQQHHQQHGQQHGGIARHRGVEDNGAGGDDAARALAARWVKVLQEPTPNAGHRGASAL